MPIQQNDQARRLTLQILDRLVPRALAQDVSIKLWDNTRWPDDRPRAATVALHFPGALRTIFASGSERGLGEGFLRGEFDIEGNVEAVLKLADQLKLNDMGLARKAAVATRLLRLPRGDVRFQPRAPAQLEGKRHSIERDRAAVAYHYNASNDFYKLWLDERLVYSCAYFSTPHDSLGDAQLAKLDLICRKLRLKPGQKLLDLGCGWGALVIHAAKYFGVDATGITLSEPQVEEASKRIHDAGLASTCRVRIQDYREVPAREEFDALSSVGMFEHVGIELLRPYFERALEHVKPGGVFLNHGIALNAGRDTMPPGSFIDRYVFPDGETVALNYTLQRAEEAGWEIRDVESLREHYALTLRAWVKNLEDNREQVLATVDEATWRVWRLYMASSAYGFSTNRISIFQTLLAKPNAEGKMKLPLRREDWYRED
jgi:cyclopropane-fatty-acyl-phospholipid synthase